MTALAMPPAMARPANFKGGISKNDEDATHSDAAESFVDYRLYRAWRYLNSVAQEPNEAASRPFLPPPDNDLEAAIVAARQLGAFVQAKILAIDVQDIVEKPSINKPLDPRPHDDAPQNLDQDDASAKPRVYNSAITKRRTARIYNQCAAEPDVPKVVIAASIPAEDAESLKALAQLEGVSVSMLVRGLVRDKLAKSAAQLALAPAGQTHTLDLD